MIDSMFQSEARAWTRDGYRVYASTVVQDIGQCSRASNEAGAMVDPWRLLKLSQPKRRQPGPTVLKPGVPSERRRQFETDALLIIMAVCGCMGRRIALYRRKRMGTGEPLFSEQRQRKGEVGAVLHKQSANLAAKKQGQQLIPALQAITPTLHAATGPLSAAIRDEA